MDPDYEEPTVTLRSFKAMPSEGGIPAFEIGLHVLNPNASPFRLEGVVYTVSIQGHDVVKGVGKDFPVLEGYSEQTIKLTATANLFAGIRLVMDLMNSPGKDLNYEFEAKLDTGGFGRSIRIREKGSFRMDGKGNSSVIGNNSLIPET
jgi:LEA14-like dessication related protein